MQGDIIAAVWMKKERRVCTKEPGHRCGRETQAVCMLEKAEGVRKGKGIVHAIEVTTSGTRAKRNRKGSG